eukprot:1332758-Amorphochlora_amoeboformis.AAC.1
MKSEGDTEMGQRGRGGEGRISPAHAGSNIQVVTLVCHTSIVTRAIVPPFKFILRPDRNPAGLNSIQKGRTHL